MIATITNKEVGLQIKDPLICSSMNGKVVTEEAIDKAICSNMIEVMVRVRIINMDDKAICRDMKLMRN